MLAAAIAGAGAGAAASTTSALAVLRLVTLCTGMTVLLLRYGSSGHGIRVTLYLVRVARGTA